MSKWRYETNDDGDEVIYFDETHSLITWNLEDTDKCCYEILNLMVAAPELLRVCREALEDIRNCGELTLGTINNINEVVREAKYGRMELPEDWQAIYGEEMEELSDPGNDNFGEFSEDNLLMFSMQRKTNENND